MGQICHVAAAAIIRLHYCARPYTILLILAGLLPICLLAQTDRGTIEGIVTDSIGGPVANALVVITHVETKDVLELRTNQLGRYMGPNLPIGTYRVAAQAQGFQVSVRDGLRLEAQSSVRVDFLLNLSTVQQTIVVPAQTPSLDASNPTISSTLTDRQVEDLPVVNIGAKRNIGQWLQFLPGVNSASTWGARINGANGGNSEIFLDGAPASQGNVRGGIQETGPDVATVSEFSVVTNSFNAEYGRTGAWFTNIVIKSGTDSLHGSLYDHFANDALNARSFFQTQKSEMRQHDSGFTIGGPVRIPKLYGVSRDKTFFFFGQELFFYRQQGGTGLATVPTEAFRSGDFSRLIDGRGSTIPIFDPATTTNDDRGGFVRAQFPGNVIPASRISPISKQMVALMLPPDIAERQESNFHLKTGRISDTRVSTIKLDQNLNQNQRLSLTAIFQTRPTEWTGQGWGLLLPIDGSESPKNVRSFNARINYDWILRPNVLNHAVIGGDGMDNQAVTSTLGQSWDARLGITGLPADSGMFPNVIFSGGTAAPLALGGANYSRNVSSRLSFNDNLTWVHGKHTFKFGVNLIREQYSDLEGGASSGIFGFSNLTTSQPNSPNFNQWGSSFASFLLGDVNNTNTATISDFGWRLNYQAAFIQDEWRATPHFTLSYGLRYERYPGAYEQHDRATSFNPATPNPAADNIPGALTFAGIGPGRTGARSFAKAWAGVAPRLGMAYEITSKTVVRASGGIFFAPGVTPRIDATGFTATPSFSSPNGFSPVYNWANFWPQNWAHPPNIDPSFANGQAVSYLPPNAARPPQIASWTFTVQKQLPGDIAVEAGYIGSKSTHLEIGSTLAAYWNVLNPAYLSLGNLLNQPIDSAVAKAAGYTTPFPAFTGLPMHTVGQSLRPYPQYANVNMPYSPEGISNYNALQLKVAKRYSENLTFLAFYTRSKLMTNDDFAPIDLGEGPGNIQNPLNRAGEYSVSQDDYPNVFGVSFSYELPFGHGERWLNHRRFLRKVLSNWQIAGSIQRQSGTPLSITAGTALAQFGFPVIRADYVNGENVYPANSGFDPARDFFLNSAAFSAPTAFRFGNTGRVLNWVRGPGVASEALSIERKISFTERFDTTLRMDAINPFNFVRWTNPNTNVNDANFGSINAARPGRVVQISLKVSF